MRELFKLVGEVSIAGVELVSKQLSGIDKKVNALVNPIDKLGKNFTNLGLKISGLVAPIAAVGAGIGLLTIKTGEYADKLLVLKGITGLSTDTLQELQFIAKQAGVNFDGLAKSIVPFTRKLPEIIKEGGAAFKTIQQLGINIYDSSGNIRDMNILFPEMIKRLQDIDNVTTRNAVASQLFGKNLGDIAPILAMTSKEFDGMRKEAKDLGLVLSEDSIKAADDYGDTIDKLKSQFQFLAMNLATDFIPIIRDSIIPLVKSQVIPAFQEMAIKIKNIISWFKGLSPETKDFIIKVGSFVAILGPALIILGKFIGTIKTVTTTILLLKTAMIALNAVMLTNPFVLAAVAIGAMTGAIILATNEYKNLRKEHESFTNVVTVEQAKTKELITGFEKLRSEVAKHGNELKDADKMQQLFGQDIENLSNVARELGYTVEGDVIQRFMRLNDISNASKQSVLDLNGALVKTTKQQNSLSKETKQFQLSGKKDDIIGFWTKGLIRLNEEQLKNTQNFQEQYNIKKLILENQKTDEINSSKKTKAELALIDAIYVQKFIELESWRVSEAKALNDKYEEDKKKVREQEQQELEKITQKKLDIETKYTTLNAETYKQKISVLRTIRDQEIADAEKVGASTLQIKSYYAQQEMQLTIDTVQQQIGLWGSAISQIIDLTRMSTQNKIMELDNQTAKEKQAIDQSTMNEKQKQEAYKKLEEKADKEKKKLQREQAKRDKAAAIFGAIVNTAQAITAALKLGFPLGLIMAVIFGALGIAQIAMIAAQPLPFAKGGMVKSKAGGVQAQIGEGNQDELILPMKTGVRILADSLLDRLAEMVVPPQQPQMALAGSNAGLYSGNTTNSRGEVHFHIGTLIADDNGLKELDRRMLPFRIADQQRKGQ